MSNAYLDWLNDLFEEAQVPLQDDTRAYIDQCLRRIAEAEDDDPEVVYRTLQRRWLRHGESGRQLLAALLRGQVYSRRDSPMRPKEGDGHYVNPGSR
jgi:hypothetical protein